MFFPSTTPYLKEYSVLALAMDGENDSTTFTDESNTVKTMTANGAAKISTAQSKSGGSSGYFDGTANCYVSTPDHSDFNLGNSDFTIEAWVRIPTSVTGKKTICCQAASSSSNNSWHFFIWNGYIEFYYTTSGTSEYYCEFSPIISADTWYHLAIIRTGGYIKCYRNGTLLGTTFSVGTGTLYNSTVDFLVGAKYSSSPTDYFTGYIDQLVITKGVCKYTSNFSPTADLFLQNYTYNEARMVSHPFQTSQIAKAGL